MNQTTTENKSCGIFSSYGGRGLCIFEPNEEPTKINFDAVSPEFKREFMEAWQKFYDAEVETDNAGINQLSVLDEMGYYLNQGELITREDTFDEAYDKVVKVMFP